MSFSSDVKEEIAGHISKSRHCQIAELAAFIVFCGRVVRTRTGENLLRFQTENRVVAEQAARLALEAFSSNLEAVSNGNRPSIKNNAYVVGCNSQKESLRILQAVKMIDANGCVINHPALVNHLVIQQNCCKRAFIRGAFLAAGSISDPQKLYHFEIVCGTYQKAEQMRDILNEFHLEAKIVKRKKHFVVYMKEGDKIVDVLNIMGAHIALMNLENVRIVKEMRNSINRQVNCETANINKTVSAAVKQVEDIEYLQKTMGLEALPDSLREIAYLRLENKEASLKELGTMLETPVGKSGVNHRLRKISILADDMREKKGGFHHD